MEILETVISSYDILKIIQNILNFYNTAVLLFRLISLFRLVASGKPGRHILPVGTAMGSISSGNLV